MELKKEIRILGRRFEVEPRAKESLKGITVGEWKSHSTLPLLATQNYPFWLKYD